MNGKLGSIRADPDIYPSLVSRYIIHAVRRDFPEVLIRKIMHIHLDR